MSIIVHYVNQRSNHADSAVKSAAKVIGTTAEELEDAFAKAHLADLGHQIASLFDEVDKLRDAKSCFANEIVAEVARRLGVKHVEIELEGTGVPASEDNVLRFIADHDGLHSTVSIAAHFGLPIEEIRTMLGKLVGHGRICLIASKAFVASSALSCDMRSGARFVLARVLGHFVTERFPDGDAGPATVDMLANALLTLPIELQRQPYTPDDLDEFYTMADEFAERLAARFNIAGDEGAQP